MNKIYNFIFVGCLFGTLLASCQEGNFLDATETTDLDEETVFADSAYTTQFLTDIFSHVGFSNHPTRFDNGGLDAASDEAEPSRSTSLTATLQFATGTVNPAVADTNAWDVPYSKIRQVNQLLHHLPEVPIADFRKEVMAAEARFLRAWYYAILLKHYGGVPIIENKIFNEDDEIPYERSTYEETVDYIVAELDTAAQNLSSVRPMARQYGRPGSGACMALKARVLLYAASPLFNGSGYGGGEPLTSIVGYPDYDRERWRLAADAAEAVINLGEYELHVDNTTEPGYGFYELFTQRVNDEYIFQRMQEPNQQLEDAWQPPSRGVTQGGGYPYQELVSAFGMSNGMPVTDPASGYDPDDPYANRDPRLTYSIVYDQNVLPKVGENQPIPVDIFLGNYLGRSSGQDAVHTGTPTGYYIRKMLDDEIPANSIVNSDRSRPLMRYAEVLLNFAEAANEYEGPTAEVYEAVELVRERAGLDPYQLEEGLSQDEMREIIRRERHVELAFEGHRFWDVRRWMIAGETQDKMMHGMEVIRDGQEAEYNTFEVRRHNFHEAMYLWPIPQNEVDKGEGKLLQNPHW